MNGWNKQQLIFFDKHFDLPLSRHLDKLVFNENEMKFSTEPSPIINTLSESQKLLGINWKVEVSESGLYI